MIARAELRAGGNGKGLEVALAIAGLQAIGFELFGDVGGGLLQLRRSGGASAHGFGGEKFHVRQVPLRVEFIGPMTSPLSGQHGYGEGGQDFISRWHGARGGSVQCGRWEFYYAAAIFTGVL